MHQLWEYGETFEALETTKAMPGINFDRAEGKKAKIHR